MNDSIAVGLAALNGTLHLLRIQVNRGFVSPNEVDTIYSSIVETMETMASPEMTAIVTAQLDQAIPEIRKFAEQRWVGRGKTNPA